MNLGQLRQAMHVVGPLLVGQAVLAAGSGISARLSASLGGERDDGLVIWLLGGLGAIAINILFYQLMFLDQMMAKSITLELATSSCLLILVAFVGDPSFHVTPVHVGVMSVLALLVSVLYAINWGWVVSVPPKVRRLKRRYNIALGLLALGVLLSSYLFLAGQLPTVLLVGLIGFTIVLIPYFVQGWRMVLREAARGPTRS